MSVRDQLRAVLSTLGSQTALIAVSKTKPVELLQEAYDAGQRDFGENKIQEMATKWELLPKDIRWHMIGHVQTNKIKYMAPFVHLVHGVDREKVLDELNKAAKKANRTIDCLLQVHIAAEETKFGFDPEEVEGVVARADQWPFVRIRGLMGMATHTDDEAQVEREFTQLRELFERFKAPQEWDTLSMGMSNDYPTAIRCGSTHVRIGSAIFGARNYNE